MFRQSLCVFVCLFVTLLASTAFSQTRVVLLKTKASDVDAPLLQRFDQEVATAIANDERLTVAGRQEVSVDDLALGAGCATADDACLRDIGKLIDGDRLVFGEITNVDGTVTTTLNMFEFATGKMVGSVERSFPVADAGNHITAVAETLVWGDSGTVEISANEADGVEVFIDDVSVGIAPVVAVGLRLGPAVVKTVRDGEKQTKDVVIRAHRISSLVFEFSSTASEENVASGPSLIPGVVLVVAGVGGITYGALMSLLLKSDHDEMQKIETEFGKAGCQCFVESTPQSAIDSYTDLESKRSTKTILQFVGYGGGAVLTGVGTYLLIRAVGKQKTSTEQSTGVDETAWRLDVSPTKDGASVSVTGTF